MDIGFSISNNQGIDSVQSIVDIATASEEQGLDSIWVSDHV
ncbi:MAG: LLM class flavin-dependent oxidoreductase, partial [SAR202 cluster bacterium]|nr:LLM class flavin-dependent oxidoreductase [SAR202 cluster bacterium]